MEQLEGVSDSEVVTHAVLEFRDIVIAFLSGIVREVQTDTHVETDDDKGEVVTQAEAGSQARSLRSLPHFSCPPGTIRIVSDQPDVAAVEEGSPMQVAKDREAVFEVGLEFKITRTVDVSVFIVVAVLVVTSGTDAADRKSTDAIRSADVELLVIREVRALP